MNKLKSIVFSSLIAGSLAIPATSAFARVEWRDISNDRAQLRTAQEELARNRQQLDFDFDHGASNYQLDRDHRAIQQSMEDVRRARETLRRDMTDYEEYS